MSIHMRVIYKYTQTVFKLKKQLKRLAMMQSAFAKKLGDVCVCVWMSGWVWVCICMYVCVIRLS